MNSNYSNDRYDEYTLHVNKHRVYCDLVHIGRKYILKYIVRKGMDKITLSKPIVLDGIHDKFNIVKVVKGYDRNSGKPYAKLYDGQGNDYILYQMGAGNLIKIIKTFKVLNKS